MLLQAQGGALPEGKSNPLFASSLLDTGGSQGSTAGAAGGGAPPSGRSNPLFDSQASSQSRKSARSASEAGESASSKFRALFSRRRRTETS